jgi:ABC-type nitrate/sulfonate/bicarbonate transport system permease component
MTRHLKRRLRSLFGFFALGLLTDVLVVLYLRAVSHGLVPLAMVLSFLVTIVPFLVTERGISAGRRELFVAYALGAAVGTCLGMLVRLA